MEPRVKFDSAGPDGEGYQDGDDISGALHDDFFGVYDSLEP